MGIASKIETFRTNLRLRYHLRPRLEQQDGEEPGKEQGGCQVMKSRSSKREAVKWKRLREEAEEEMEETAEKNLKPVTKLPRLDQL